MRICPSMFSGANRNSRTRRGQIGNTCTFAVLIVVFAQLSLPGASAQNMVMPPAESMGGGNGAPPMSASGDVNFFSQDLGTILRLRYETESYGQDSRGNFDVGSMQVITLDDSAVIADGQVTMNEDDGVGFNVGAGYRWMNFPMLSPEGRVDGIGIFADGMHTDAGNFFPQIGASYESLGELWDFRGNIYVPLGPQTQVGNFKPTGAIGFQGNSLSQLTQAGVDTSFTVGEIEIARRLGQERDAWGFAGPYFVANSDDSSAGYRVGVRGYAYPDLLLQFALTGDEIFHTEATFSLTWFVGRTRTNFQPAGNVADRIREPFMRNDYVALSKSTQAGGIPLTNPDGTALRFVHVASNAAAGGNGTLEAPFNELNQAGGTGSQTGDIIFAHSTSVFDTPIVLKDNQKLLGEGNNTLLTVNTKQKGTITIPESSPGARALARPIIDIPSNTDAVTLANNNEVANFDMNGNNNVGTRAIVAPAGGAGNPNLHDLAISNTSGDAIFFKPDSFVDTNDTNGNGNTTETIVPGNVTINKVTLTNVGGNGINIDSAAPAGVDVTMPNVTLQELIAISNVTSTGGAGRGISIANTHTGPNRVTTLTNYTYDGGTTSLGGIQLSDFDGTFNASTSSLTGGAAAGKGIQVLGDTDGIVNFANTVTMTSIAGTDIDINGDVAGTDSLNGHVTFGNAINNTAGQAISVQNVAANSIITFNGNVTDSGTGILVNSNSGGEVAFVGTVNSNIATPGVTAINLTNNTGANVDFTNAVTIAATGAGTNGFSATGGGTISAPSTTNSISTTSGQPLKITGMTIAAGGVAFGDVNRSLAAAANAIDLETNTGGPITIGNTTDTTGQAGTIVAGAANPIRIVDSANVSITGLIVNNAAGFEGVHVEQTDATKAMTVNLSDLTINDGNIGINTIGAGTGASAITMTVNDTNINRATATGAVFNNVDVTGGTGGVQVNHVVVDGGNVNATNGGVLIQNSNGSFTFNNTTQIKKNGGTDFEVASGTPTISYAGSIQNSSTLNAGDTSGKSVHIHDITGGTVGFTAASTIADNNAGMLVENNGSAAINFLGTNTLNTTTGNTAITLNNNDVGGTNANITFAGLNITGTGTGVGFLALSGGTLSITGPTNVINTDNGAGLILNGMTIGAGGADFQSITVDGTTGPTNAITLQDLTGGLVSIGPGAGANGAGGSLKSTGDAIVIQNVQSAILSQVRIVSAGSAAGDNGVEIAHTSGATTAMDITFDDLHVDSAFDRAVNVAGANSNAFNLRLTGDTTTGSTLNNNVAVDLSGSGKFALLVDHVTVDSSANSDIAFAINQHGAAQNADITFQNGSKIAAGNAQALFIDSSNANAKTVNVLIAGTPGSTTANTQFTNSSATLATADIELAQTGTMNQTVRGTTFQNNTAGGVNYSTSATGAAATMNLSLGGSNANDKNTASGGLARYDLTNTGATATFNIFDKTNTLNNTRNIGTVNPIPNAAAFNDTTTVPPTPTGP